jgi:hypothetical protein
MLLQMAYAAAEFLLWLILLVDQVAPLLRFL